MWVCNALITSSNLVIDGFAFIRLTEASKYDSIYLRPHGQAVKTSPFHGGNTSSNLVGVIYGDIAKW